MSQKKHLKNEKPNLISKIRAHTKIKRTRIDYVWKIEDFSYCCKKYEVLESSNFGSNEAEDSTHWCLRLYPNGVNKEHEKYMGLFLALVQDADTKKGPKVVVYTCCIIDSKGEKMNLVRCQPEGREFSEGDSWGFPKFIHNDILKADIKQFIVNDRLTIALDMCVLGDMTTSGDPKASSDTPESDYKDDQVSRKKSKKNLKTLSNKPDKTPSLNKIEKEKKIIIKSKKSVESSSSNEKTDPEIELNAQEKPPKSRLLKKKKDLMNTVQQTQKVENVLNQHYLNNNKESPKNLSTFELYDLSNIQQKSSHGPHSITSFRQDSYSTCQNIGKLDLSDFLLNQKFADVYLITCDGKRIPAHKLVLASQSSVFNRMIETQQNSSNLQDIELKGISANVLQEVLRYLYTGSTCNLRLPAYHLLSAADSLDLDKLKDWCEESMLLSISINNAADFLVLSDKHGARLLRTRLIDYLKQNATAIMQTEGWKRIMESHPAIVADIFKHILSLK